MITEAAIIRMLLNSHHLNGIVAVLLDARQHILSKLLIGTHLLGILTHTHVALVNQQRRLIGLEGLFLPYIRFLWVPHLGRENLRLVILYHTTAPSGNTLTLATVPVYLHLVQLSMLQGFFREFQFPVACSFNTLTAIFLCFLPIVEITNQIDIRSIGSPLTEHPSLRQLMQTKIKMTRGKLRQSLLTVTSQLTYFPQGMIMTATNRAFKRFKP